MLCADEGICDLHCRVMAKRAGVFSRAQYVSTQHTSLRFRPCAAVACIQSARTQQEASVGYKHLMNIPDPRVRFTVLCRSRCGSWGA
jgi:hypothetical protein